MSKKRKWIPESEIHHVWAHRAEPEGKIPPSMIGGISGYSQYRGHRQSFEGDLFYSYSTGIARLGKHKGKEYVVINTADFGPTTKKHVDEVKRATSHMKQFFGEFGGRGTNLDVTPKEIVKHYADLGHDKMGETHKQKRIQYGIWMEAKRWFERAVGAAEFFRMGTYGLRQMVAKCEREAEPYREAAEKWEAGSLERQAKRDAARRYRQENWDKIQAERNRSAVERFIADPNNNPVPYHGHVTDDLMDAYLAACKTREDFFLERNKKWLDSWMNGDQVSTGHFHDLPVRLRMVAYGEGEDQIETSHGAVIPYRDGRLCYKFCARLWRQEKAWHRNGEEFKVGPYHLDAVRPTFIQAGCHKIDREEIERFAQQEGWVTPSTEETDEDTTTNETVA